MKQSQYNELRTALADLCSAVSRGQTSGNAFKCKALTDAIKLLNQKDDWQSNDYRKFCSPSETMARADY